MLIYFKIVFFFCFLKIKHTPTLKAYIDLIFYKIPSNVILKQKSRNSGKDFTQDHLSLEKQKKQNIIYNIRFMKS